MKFSKTLEDEAIPEWRANYFDYKQAKKKLKAIEKAVRNVPSTPQSNGNTNNTSSLRDGPVLSLLRRRQTTVGSDTAAEQTRFGRGDAPATPLQSHLATGSNFTPPIKAYKQKLNGQDDRVAALDAVNERSSLKGHEHTGITRDLPQEQKRMRSYGSIIGSPPEGGEAEEAFRLKHQASSLRLPNPAVPLDDDPEYDRPLSPLADAPETKRAAPKPPATQLAHTGNAYEIRPPVDRSMASNHSIRRLQLQKSRSNSTPTNTRPFSRRLFSVAGNFTTKSRREANENSTNDVALEAYRELDFRKADFFLYLDKELAKINTFYTTKEDDAVKHLAVLRQQLHIMRERRVEEIEHQRSHAHQNQADPNASKNSAPNSTYLHIPFMGRRADGQPSARQRLASSVDFAHDALDRVRTGHVGKTSRAMDELGTPPGHWQPDAEQRDYARRADVSHHTAKRKMKAALAEFYRSLELLKSYASTNRTAFRKIVKKYDKTARTRQKGQYMDENVNQAHFVMSDTIESLMSDSESLYARYFERGNRKIAVSKLRAKVAKAGDYTDSVARSCLFLGTGSVLAIYGLVDGLQLLRSPDPIRSSYASFLLQLYAGYFLTVLLAGLFCLDAGMFAKYKVNYHFIFELEPRSLLEWLQLSEIPAAFFFLMSLIMWLNFSIKAGGDVMYVWWFVVLIGVSGVLIFFPFRILYYKTRKFFLVSLGRLLLSGYYHVEFRDFFLGDMFCSLTYPMGNIELFFCLYSRDWTGDIHQCTSSRSRLLGFFSAVPGIWRALQCIRRYSDSGAIFPHLFNFGKYICTVLQYVSLSVYRIDHNVHAKAFFIVAATVNSVYCTIWDINYDWSLLDKKAKYPGLRNQLTYRKIVWIYYVAWFLDPVLRFNWIFYAIYTEDIQHATTVSFLVALSEVFRRGLWTLFRVENEHCSNIFKGKATRDFDLPYDIPDKDTAYAQTDSSRQSPRVDGSLEQGGSLSTSAGPETTSTRPAVDTDSPIARALQRVGTNMRTGHQQDYERKKKSDYDQGPEDSDEGDSDDDE